MGSMSNSNPWSPYDSYNDCSQGICNIYCPQWCYLIFPPPPPPPFFLDDSSSKLSPLLIALIGILASAFVLVTYYTLISKYCHRRCDNSSSEAPGFFSSSAIESGQGTSNAAASTGDGLSDSLIRSIKVYKYRKGDGFVDGSDCSVCLSEFEENESLRLLPKCNHAFHLPCIDTWLKSHSNCPLCRAFVTGAIPTTTIAEADLVVANYSSSVHQTAVESTNRGGETEEINSNMNGYHQQIGDFNSVVVMEDLEIDSRNSNDRSEEQRNTKAEYPQQIRRSVSLNSGTVISIGDVIREIKDEEESAGVGTSQQREEGEENGHGEQKTPPTTEAQRSSGGVSSFLIRSSESMKRSVSTGRFMFSRNYRLPI